MRAPMDDPFIQIDRAEVSAALKLKERGAEQGTLELPQSSSETLDVVETEVAAFVQEHFGRAQIDAANSVRTYDSRLNGLSLIANLGSIRTQAKLAVGDFKAEVLVRRGRLTNSRDAISGSYGELRDFKNENGLKRPAHEAAAPISTYGTMAVCWLIETIANSMLLRLNDSMGYLGGVLAAAIVGAINVFVAGVAGRLLWPRKNLKGATARTLAGIGITLWIIFTLVWNLMAAHYRDAKSLGIPHPETAALGMLGSGLDSLYSYGLVVAGIVFAITAAMAGYKMDDPYPGYGATATRHAKRCDDYVAEFEDAKHELTDIRDDAIEQATDVREELARQHAERQQILTAREAFRRRYDEYGTQLEAVANALLQEYRNANRAARSTPAPDRFETSWRLSRTPLPLPGGDGIPRSAIEAAEENLEAAVDEISTAFDEAIASFEPLDELKKRIADD